MSDRLSASNRQMEGAEEPDELPVSEPQPIARREFAISVPAELFDALVEAVSAHVAQSRPDETGKSVCPEWMSVETAARYLDVSPHRLRKLQAQREVPFHQEAPGCRVFFRRRDLDDWLAELRHPLRRSWIDDGA